VIRPASSKKDRDTARALLEEYLRLPVGWPKHRVPASLPAAMSEYLDGFPDTAHLSRMYVRPENRNRGLGRQFLAEALHRASCRRIRLVPRQATFARLTTSRSIRSCACRLRQAM
jgi:GNAT superfamily N-acetyltransferase